jgi:predicted nuclease of predicted toxin-antitoxin system
VRFLIDQNLSPEVAELLRPAGHDAVHTSQVGMKRSDDAEVLDWAATEERILVSADTDFGTLLAERATDKPSLILFRRSQGRRATAVADLILANLGMIEEPLADGAIVVLQEARVRIRRLPIR